MANPARDFRNNAQSIWPDSLINSRGRNWIKHQHPLIENKKMLDVSIGPIHIENTEIEIDTAWIDAESSDSPYQKKMVLADYNAYFGNGNLELDSAFPFRYVNPNTGDWLNWQPNPNVQWTNDVNSVSNVGLTKQPVVAQFINDDTLYFPGAYGTGIDLYLELQTARLQKRLRIDSLSAPPQSILDGGNPVLMLSYQIQRSPGVTIWLNGTQWGEGNGQGNARASTNQIEFRASDGTVLWYLSPAYCWDNEGNFVTGPIRVRRAGTSYMVELRVPWSWLQTAVYPVFLDPTIEPQVGASADDADEVSTGTVSITRTPLLNTDNTSEWNSFRFTGVNLSNIDTFDVAYLIFYFTGASLDEPDLTIYGLDTSSPAQFSTGNNDISSRTRTTASVNWGSTNLGAPGAFNTSSIISILDEQYASYGPYSSGVLGYVTTSRANDSTRDTSIESYDGSTTNAAKIHIEYTEVGQTPPSVTLDTADDSDFSDPTPTLLFTGTDPESDDIRYNIQITDNPDSWAGGTLLSDNYDTGSSSNFHLQPSNNLTWESEYHTDDRPGQSFEGFGGILDHIDLYIFLDETGIDGYAKVRVYAHQGTYGTSSEPLNANDPEDTPTHNWLAESEYIYIDDTFTGPWTTFDFTGLNRIRLENGVKYVLVLNWEAETSGITNNIVTKAVATSPSHAGNFYNDGWSSNNNGPQPYDLWFKVYEDFLFLDKVSGTDSGFVNQDNGGDSDPFTSGDQIGFTVQSGDSLPDGIYYWRVRGIDPTPGSNTYGSWTTARTFTILVGLSPSGSTHSHSADNVVLTQVHSLAVQDSLHSHSAENVTLSVVTDLVIQDASHGHTADNLVLTQTHVLAIQDAIHNHTVDNLVLTQVHSLVINDALHNHSADNLVLTQVHGLNVQDALHAHTAENVNLVINLVIQDSSHSHTAENINLVQQHTLVIQDSIHSHTAENLTLTQNHVLSINDSSHGHTAENLVLTQVHNLVANDSLHSHSAENVVLTQVHNLVIQDALHNHYGEEVTLTIEGDLEIQDSAHSHSADNLVLTQVHSLSVSDALHSHSAENINLVVNLVIQDALHSHTADNLTLTQTHILSVQDALHSHFADNVTLSVLGDLEPQDSLHSHSADNVTLTQVHNLAIQDSLHNHSAENIVLTQNHILVTNDSLHGHSADNVTLSVDITLDINDGLHSHTAENITLTQVHILAIQDALHSHFADNVSFSQEYNIVIQDGLHGHIADNLNLVVDLNISDSVHSQTADNVILSPSIIVQDALHGHLAENVTLTQLHILMINDSVLSITSDLITIGGVSKPGHATLGRGKRGVGVSREKIGAIDIRQSHQHTEVH